MAPKSHQFLNDLTRAAEMRANGIGWNAIARTLKCSPETCQSWPKRFPRTWDSLLGEANREVLHQARGEAIQALRQLLRSSNPHIVLSVAKTILKLTANSASPLSAAERSSVPTPNIQPFRPATPVPARQPGCIMPRPITGIPAQPLRPAVHGGSRERNHRSLRSHRRSRRFPRSGVGPSFTTGYANANPSLPPPFTAVPDVPASADSHSRGRRIERTSNSRRRFAHDVRVDHRRSHVVVAEQLLHRPNVLTHFQKVRRKTVPQRLSTMLIHRRCEFATGIIRTSIAKVTSCVACDEAPMRVMLSSCAMGCCSQCHRGCSMPLRAVRWAWKRGRALPLPHCSICADCSMRCRCSPG